jgi:hypothetical protein
MRASGTSLFIDQLTIMKRLQGEPDRFLLYERNVCTSIQFIVDLVRSRDQYVQMPVEGKKLNFRRDKWAYTV